jgi:heme-degrading monooxygenase HmoA
MFARVIATEVTPDQLPAAVRQPGFRGFYLLTDAGTGKVMTISLWETREQLAAVEARAAGIRQEEGSSLGAPSLSVETYEVTLTV